MCHDNAECYEMITNIHLGHRSNIKPRSDNRTKIAAAIIHIQCLIGKLQREQPLEPVNEVCPFPDLSTLTMYNNTYPSFPVEGQCTLESIAVHPGHADWAGDEYAFMSTMGGAQQSGITCF